MQFIAIQAVGLSLMQVKVITQFFQDHNKHFGCQLLTNKIDIIKLFGVLWGRKDGFKLDQTSDYDV